MEKRLKFFVEAEDEDYLEYKKLAQKMPKYSNVFNLISTDSQRHASYFRKLLLGEDVKNFPLPPKRIRVPQAPNGYGVWDERLREELSAIKVYLAFGEEHKKLKPLMRSIVADEIKHYNYLQDIKSKKSIKVAPRENPIDWAMLGASVAGTVIASLIATAIITHSIRSEGKKSLFHRGDLADKIRDKVSKRKKNPPIDWQVTGSIGRMVAEKGNKKVVITKRKDGPYRFKFYKGNKKLVDATKENTDEVIELTTSLVTEDPDKVFSSIESVYKDKSITNLLPLVSIFTKENPDNAYFTIDAPPNKGDYVYYDIIKAKEGSDIIPDIKGDEILEVLEIKSFGDRKYAEVRSLRDINKLIVGKNLFVNYLWTGNLLKSTKPAQLPPPIFDLSKEDMEIIPLRVNPPLKEGLYVVLDDKIETLDGTKLDYPGYDPYSMAIFQNKLYVNYM